MLLSRAYGVKLQDHAPACFSNALDSRSAVTFRYEIGV